MYYSRVTILTAQNPELHVDYVDVHSHLYEYDNDYIGELVKRKRILIVVVSDDYESSLRVIELAKSFPQNILPCVGLHPWEVGKKADPVNEANKIVEIALENNVSCLGEIGLDTKFVGDTIEVQRRVFNVFIRAAKEYDLTLNLHTAGTWEEVYEILVRNDIGRAVFHWYTGPLYMLTHLYDAGYFISVNPAIKIQQKHRAVVSAAPLDMLVSESDSPYEYRGIKMTPLLVEDVVKEIAAIKNEDPSYVAKALVNNAWRLFGR